MKKEMFWNLKVDGTRHEIRCEDKGNSFDVYVDDEFRYNIRSDINLDIEEDLTVGSKRCRMVVYRGVPDLAVDGILLNADAEILRKEKRDRRLVLIAGLFLICLGTMAMAAWAALNVTGQYYIGGFMAPVFAVLVFGAGVFFVIRFLRKREY